MKLTLGHSPDPDDAFMFHALAKGQIDTEGLEFEHLLQDIETLNRRAERSELDVTALSAHAYAFLTDRYLLLNSGASMGLGYGPSLVAREPLSLDECRKRPIAVPGERTSAFLALRLYLGEFQYRVVAFDRIIDAVRAGETDAGLLIHEGQLTYAGEGLCLVVDLGAWWSDLTSGLPLPLGVNAIRRDLPNDLQLRVDRVLRRSVEWGLAHRQEALVSAAAWGRDLDDARTDRFVSMYVNDLTLDYGDSGRRALGEFLRRGAEAGLLPARVEPEFVGDS
ncbi:ABC transporter substrate-binding protein [Candidatus Sumerlaeota bacterium]|nr:ABC transporter substrate-binding protein [Candidatus Sumerlaeota bacterium]